MYKVLLVVSNNLMHGTERYVLDLAKQLPKNLYDVYIATPCEGPFSELILTNGLKEIIYGNGKLNKFSFKGSLNLFKIIKKNKFDIIQANSGIIPCIIGKILGVKLCIEIKHGIFYSDKQLSKISFKVFLFEYIKQYFVDFFIAISENDKVRLVKYFKINEKKIRVIYNGLNIKEVESKSVPIQSCKNGNIVSIGTVGRFNFQKAYDVLVEVIEEVIKNFQDVKFYFIGTGEEEEKIRSMIKQKKLEKYIEFIGYTKEIYIYIQKFDIFILTSRYEGIPYVVLEAMYLGIPIICTNVGGINNILINKKDAFLTEIENIKETAESIMKLINDKELRVKFISNCKEIVKNYTVEKMAENTSDLYLTELNKK